MPERRIDHAIANLSEVKLHYAHSGEGRLLLFLHGFPEFWYEWKEQLAFFSDSHLAVAPDQRGYNLSSRPSQVSEYAIQRLANDVRELIAHLGRERCSLVAHDWGGFVACVVAHLYPETVGRLILINSCNPTQWMHGFRSMPEQIAASQYVHLFRSEQAEAALSVDDYVPFASQAFRDSAGNPILPEAELALYREAWSRPGGLTGGLNYYRALPVSPGAVGEPTSEEPAPIPDYPIEVPTRIIWGDADAFLRRELLDIQPELFSNLDIQLISGASHWVVHEQPETVNRLIAEFLP